MYPPPPVPPKLEPMPSHPQDGGPGQIIGHAIVVTVFLLALAATGVGYALVSLGLADWLWAHVLVSVIAILLALEYELRRG